MRKWWIAPVAVVALVAAVFAYLHYSVRESTDDAQIDGHVNPVSARVGGPVLAVLVQDNQRVKAGDVLVRIDPRDYEVALAKAQADLGQAEAARLAAASDVPLTTTNASSSLNAAASDTGMASARVSAASARVREAEANALRASADLERIKALVDKDEVSRQEYDARVADAAAARAAVDSARASEQEAHRGVEVADARLRQANTGPQQVAVVKARWAEADARVAESRARVEEAQLNLSYTTVKATVDGFVSRRGVEVGQMVAAGQPLLALVDLDNVWVTANFKEGQVAHMHAGQEVKISVDAFGGRRFRGRIDSIAAATGARFSILPAENATGNYVKVVQRVPVKIAIDHGDNDDHVLRPGLSVVPTVMLR